MEPITAIFACSISFVFGMLIMGIAWMLHNSEEA